MLFRYHKIGDHCVSSFAKLFDWGNTKKYYASQPLQLLHCKHVRFTFKEQPVNCLKFKKKQTKTLCSVRFLRSPVVGLPLTRRAHYANPDVT